MNPLFKPCEHKFLTIWCNQWELGSDETAVELIQIANLFLLERREEKETLIRSRLGVLVEYNGFCAIWKHENHAGR